MPKNRSVSGVDRFNLLLAMLGYLIHTEEPVALSVIAKHFDISEAEAEAAITTITLSGVGSYFPGELFDIDFDLLEEKREIYLTCNPGLDDVPKISGRQLAALSAGLNLLKSIPGFTKQSEVEELTEILKSGTAGPKSTTLQVQPGTVSAATELLRDAISSGRRIRATYRNASQDQRVRLVDPLRIESQDETWFLRGWCPERQQVLTFRLDRMRDIEILSEKISNEAALAEIPEQIYSANLSDTQVTMRVRSAAVRLIADYQPQASPVALDENWLEFQVSVRNLSSLAKVVAKYGGDAIVVGPAEARAEVRNFALRALGQTVVNTRSGEEE